MAIDAVVTGAAGGIGRALAERLHTQGVELLLAETRSVEQDGARCLRVLRRDGLGHCRHARVDRLRQLVRDQIAKGGHSSGREADEGQRPGRAQNDRAPDVGAEHFAVEDHVGILALDADLVGLGEMDSA